MSQKMSKNAPKIYTKSISAIPWNFTLPYMLTIFQNGEKNARALCSGNKMETNGNKKYKCSQTGFPGSFSVTENGLASAFKKVLILWKHILKMSNLW